MGEPVRILIADDHPVVRFGLTQMLNAEPEFAVVGEASDANEVVERVQALGPDVTVLDMEMGEAHGVDALRALRAVDQAARVIIYTGYDDTERIVEAVHLGIQGYLLKDLDGQELVRAIRAVHGGETVFQPAVTTKLLQHMRRESSPDGTQPEPLSERERQVLVLMAEGRSNQAIADDLCISERTVKFHVSSILAKLAVKNRTEAVMTAIKHGMVKPEIASD
ncbi:MAG: response regulator [Planctomycetota bacterium]|jgi:DNA-binding NarL/FixJ family response regulator